MKGNHPRPADRCPFVLRHSISQVTSFMQLGMLCKRKIWGEKQEIIPSLFIFLRYFPVSNKREYSSIIVFKFPGEHLSLCVSKLPTRVPFYCIAISVLMNFNDGPYQAIKPGSINAITQILSDIVSRMLFPSQFKLRMNDSALLQPNCGLVTAMKLLHMTRQLCYRGLCNNF